MSKTEGAAAQLSDNSSHPEGQRFNAGTTNYTQHITTIIKEASFENIGKESIADSNH
jgi:hypothetical protein